MESDLQQIPQELRLELKFQENLSTGNSAKTSHERGDCLHWERLFGYSVTDGEIIFQVKDPQLKMAVE